MKTGLNEFNLRSTIGIINGRMYVWSNSPDLGNKVEIPAEMIDPFSSSLYLHSLRQLTGDSSANLTKPGYFFACYPIYTEDEE